MPKTLNILLADDDKDDRFFFEEALQEVPIPTHLTTVEDGQKLLQFLKGNKGELPDIIFLDINMPRKNGNECLTEIKVNKKLEKIPVIMYSTSYSDEVANLLYEKGAHYFLVKPNITELPNALYRILTILTKNPQRPPRDKFFFNILVS